MERKTKILFQGVMADATVIDINSSQESWNQYLLSDGTVLKTKSVATEVARIDGQYAPDGNPLYVVKAANIMAADVPEGLKKH